ncbi:MAG: fluoride efflux transporter CrcB [Tannerella sp.]|jgi:CrcB protein|nr:fluoride efflux transporter CrcB [Tannerella sp.]
MIRTLLFIGLGGGAGSIFRYLTSVVVTRYFQSVFPLAIFIVNVSGCFLIGLFLGLSERHPFANSDLKWLFITGFCGGYTTFSTFSAENVGLVQSGHYLTAALYAAASVLAGLGAVWIGLILAKP